jgi:Beta-ketoacyl synthase, N-terminal domain
MQFEFSVLDWCACASGLSTPDGWLNWAKAIPAFPQPSLYDVPPLADMPAMMRRRLNRVGRMACHVAHTCDRGQITNPIIFASRYGDTDKALSLLGDLVKGEPMSPTGFGLSVHNAIAAQYGICRGHLGNAIAVAGGQATVSAAIVEASALLHDGADDVLVVFYETPLSSAYQIFHDEKSCEYAWAWRVGRADHPQGLARVQVSYAADVSPSRDAHDQWPSGLKVLRYFLRNLARESSIPSELVCSEPFGANTRWAIHVQ